MRIGLIALAALPLAACVAPSGPVERVTIPPRSSFSAVADSIRLRAFLNQAIARDYLNYVLGT